MGSKVAELSFQQDGDRHRKSPLVEVFCSEPGLRKPNDEHAVSSIQRPGSSHLRRVCDMTSESNTRMFELGISIHVGLSDEANRDVFDALDSRSDSYLNLFV